MASIDTGGGGGGGKKGTPKRINTRVDFTPMVDMNMLLLTFFMLCTTLSKPSIMKLVMPVPDENVVDKTPDTVDSQAFTFILDENNEIYYYNGKITDSSYMDYNFLKKTAYPTKDSNGFRQILLEQNAGIVKEMNELRERRRTDNTMTEEEFEKAATEIKKKKEYSKTTPVVMIKAVNPNPDGEGYDKTKGATYANLVAVLDEMAICSIGRYSILDITEADLFVLKNLKSKGEYGAQREIPGAKSSGK